MENNEDRGYKQRDREMDRDRHFRGRSRREVDYDDPESERFRKMFVGGLCYETEDETLQKYFEEWGEILDCIVMKEPGTKRYSKTCVKRPLSKRPQIGFQD